MKLTREWVLEKCKQGMTQREIAIEANCSQSRICGFCKQNNIVTPKHSAANRIDLSGKKCGKLAVVSYDKTIGKEAYWLCKCDCGKEKIIKGKHIKTEKIKSCGCIRNEPSKNRKGFEEIPANYLRDLRNKADNREIQFSVTPEEMWKKFIKQDRKCALSGVDLYFPANQSKQLRSSQTSSLDRINSSKGYVSDNIQWVHKRINLMKQHLPDEEFISWCGKVAAYQINKGSLKAEIFNCQK